MHGLWRACVWFIRRVARLLSRILSLLPSSFRNFVGDVIGIIWFDIFRLRRKVAIENVAIAFPELTRTEQIAIARHSLMHLGKNILDYTLFPYFKRTDIPRYFDFEGLEFVEAARAEGKGVLFLGLHIGSGDFGIAAVSQMDWPVSLISKRFNLKWLNQLWFGMRERHGTQFISPEKSSFEILRALKQNRIVVFVLDQFMGPPIGCKTQFFGRETGSAMGLALIAERTGAPVIPCSTYRMPSGRHRIVFEPRVEWQDLGPNASRQENITAMTQVYTSKIEEIIRRHPEQWMWIHRRWKNFA